MKIIKKEGNRLRVKNLRKYFVHSIVWRDFLRFLLHSNHPVESKQEIKYWWMNNEHARTSVIRTTFKKSKWLELYHFWNSRSLLTRERESLFTKKGMTNLFDFRWFFETMGDWVIWEVLCKIFSNILFYIFTSQTNLI